MAELNRFGITSVIDAGGGFQNFPEDYKVVHELNEKKQLTVRIAYNLFTQRPRQEFEDFEAWTNAVELYQGDDMYRHNGAGEMLVFSAADFEDFLQPRPDLPENMEAELERVVRLLVERRWPFRLHATYNESITRFLNVFEKVNSDIPFAGIPWIFDHAETIDEKNIERVRALGGGIAIQSRMAYQGEYFTERYGQKAALQTPPVKKMLEMGVPVGGGSDATRVSSYNPWVSMFWLCAGKTVGGLKIYNEESQLSRETALELYTRGSAWFSNEQQKKGDIAVGMFADLAVLNKDYFKVEEELIKGIEADLTIVDGKIVQQERIFLLSLHPKFRYFRTGHQLIFIRVIMLNPAIHQCRFILVQEAATYMRISMMLYVRVIFRLIIIQHSGEHSVALVLLFKERSWKI
ncbi:amidohydrolase family protein [Pedobacter sp. NJ-S-72]